MTDVEKSEILHIWHVFDEENVATYGKFMLLCCIAQLSAQISASKFQNLSQIPLKNRGVWENSL